MWITTGTSLELRSRRSRGRGRAARPHCTKLLGPRREVVTRHQTGESSPLPQERWRSRKTSYLVRDPQIFVPGQESFNDGIVCERGPRLACQLEQGCHGSVPGPGGEPCASWGSFRTWPRVRLKGRGQRRLLPGQGNSGGTPHPVGVPE